MRMPNGYGSITKMTDKPRRCPYRVRKVIGYKDDLDGMTCRPIYANVGYFRTKKEAMAALEDFNKMPFDARSVKKTLKEVFDLWYNNKTDISDGLRKTYFSAFKWFSALFDKPMCSLKIIDYEREIEKMPRTTKQKAIVVINSLYKYGMKYEYIDKDLSGMLSAGEDQSARIERNVFTDDEIHMLRDTGNLFSDMILFALYTGFRPGEVVSIKSCNVNLDELTVMGGIKTEAGKDRVVPIHRDIVPIVKKYIGEELLFRTEILRYNYQFRKLLPNHKPHDTRHHFATRCHECGMDALVVKRIMGHSVQDLTEKVYTHTSIEEMSREMDKYSVSYGCTN